MEGILKDKDFLDVLCGAKQEFKSLWEGQVVDKHVLSNTLAAAKYLIKSVEEYQGKGKPK